MRGTQWRPNLMNRMGFEQWDSEGRKDLLAKARERLKAVMQDHQAEPLGPQQAEQVQVCIDNYRENLRS